MRGPKDDRLRGRAVSGRASSCRWMAAPAHAKLLLIAPAWCRSTHCTSTFFVTITASLACPCSTPANSTRSTSTQRTQQHKAVVAAAAGGGGVGWCWCWCWWWWWWCWWWWWWLWWWWWWWCCCCCCCCRCMLLLQLVFRGTVYGGHGFVNLGPMLSTVRGQTPLTIGAAPAAPAGCFHLQVSWSEPLSPPDTPLSPGAGGAAPAGQGGRDHAIHA